jgi:hypothetical protein
MNTSTATPPMLTPLQDSLLALAVDIFDQHVDSITNIGEPCVAPSGRATLQFEIEGAPRDWFLDPDALSSVITDALDELDDDFDAENMRVARTQSPKGARPFDQPRTLLRMCEPGDEVTYITAVGNLDSGWVMVAEAGLGDYTDEDADAYARVLVMLGTREELDRTLQRRIADAVNAACAQLANVIASIPDAYRPAATAAREAFSF